MPEQEHCEKRQEQIRLPNLQMQGLRVLQSVPQQAAKPEPRHGGSCQDLSGTPEFPEHWQYLQRQRLLCPVCP